MYVNMPYMECLGIDPIRYKTIQNVKAAGPAHEVRDERNETGRVAPHGRAYFRRQCPPILSGSSCGARENSSTDHAQLKCSACTLHRRSAIGFHAGRARPEPRFLKMHQSSVPPGQAEGCASYTDCMLELAAGSGCFFLRGMCSVGSCASGSHVL